MKKIALFALVVVLFSSCVSSKIHKELQAKYADLETNNTGLRKENDELKANLEVTQNDLAAAQAKVEQLAKDTTVLGKKYRKLAANYRELNKSYEFVLESNNALLASNQSENRKLLQKLNKLQAELQAKEDSLTAETDKLDYLGQELQKREARVNELESQIAKKDSIVNYVRQRVASALLNFEGKGLTVEMRDGKVYVSLENSLLFESAKWQVDSKGKDALEKLAGVLKENPDLKVTVEGHTDNDEFKGRTAVKDNWDLSVMRATSIVKILTDKGADPKMITAAGRGEYQPLVENTTPEDKAKNRRTEIAITPDLSSLKDILE